MSKEAQKSNYDYIVTPYQERLFPILPYPLAWLLFSSLLLGLHLGAMIYTGESIEPFWPLWVIGFLPAFLGASVVWFSKLLEQFTSSLFKFVDWPEKKIEEWFVREIRLIFNNRRMCIAGIFMVPLVEYLTITGPLLPSHKLPLITYLFLNGVLGFLAGAMIYIMIRIPVMVCELGQIKEIKISVYQHPLTSVKAIGTLLSRIALTILIIYIFGISYHLFCKANIAMLITTIFFGIFVISFFIFPQVKIHQIMSKVKHKKLLSFSEHLENALHAVTAEPSSDNIQKVRELFEIQQSLNEMGEWPFDTKLLLTVLSGVAIPILVVLLQMFCPKK